MRQGGKIEGPGLAERSEEWTASFIAAMHRRALINGPPLASGIDFTGVKKVLDLGGGSGAYSIVMARQNPDIEATIFDTKAVVPLAESYVAEAGLSDRLKTRVGDMLADDYGQGYDLVWVSAICHMFGPKENLALLKKAKESLNPGGQVVIHDFFLDEEKTLPGRRGAFCPEYAGQHPKRKLLQHKRIPGLAQSNRLFKSTFYRNSRSLRTGGCQEEGLVLRLSFLERGLGKTFCSQKKFPPDFIENGFY